MQYSRYNIILIITSLRNKNNPCLDFISSIIKYKQNLSLNINIRTPNIVKQNRTMNFWNLHLYNLYSSFYKYTFHFVSWHFHFHQQQHLAFKHELESQPTSKFNLIQIKNSKLIKINNIDLASNSKVKIKVNYPKI